MAHVQAAGDIGRRDHDAVGSAVRCFVSNPAGRRLEPASVLPDPVPVLLDCVGVVGFSIVGVRPVLRKGVDYNGLGGARNRRGNYRWPKNRPPAA